jgi:hypothetical protein
VSGYVAAAGFGRSREVFDAVVESLAGEPTAGMTHDQVEDWLVERGRELMRQLMQDHADLRAVREPRREAVLGFDAVARTRVERGHTRGLTTVFGPITVTRMAYRAPGVGNLHPADAAWNMPAGLHSHGLARLGVLEAVRGSFDEAKTAVRRATGAVIGKRQLEDRVAAAAVDVTDFYAARKPQPADPETLLVLTCDGKGVMMRPEALRQATAKAAAKTAKTAARFAPGERGNRMRMAEIAAVYDIDPDPRAPADVLTRSSTDTTAADKPPRPTARGKWLTGSITDPAAEVIAAAFDEAQRRDPDHKRTWIALVDGNTHQIDVVRAEAAEREVTVHIVIDFVHVAEYVWNAARVFYRGRPADEAHTWVRDRLAAILAGGAVEVAAGIRARATRQRLRGTDHAITDTTAGYLAGKPACLRYDQALAAGWPIATGVIEGACRHLIGDRLGITGARWGLTGAEAILLLRAVHSNGDFHDYWNYHLQQEHQRNHQTKYQQSQREWELAG